MINVHSDTKTESQTISYTDSDADKTRCTHGNIDSHARADSHAHSDSHTHTAIE